MSTEVKNTSSRTPEGGAAGGDPTTISGIPVKEIYRPDDIGQIHFEDAVGEPGSFPYTRGMHKNMYRGRTWTMRQFAGFGSAADTNERFT